MEKSLLNGDVIAGVSYGYSTTQETYKFAAGKTHVNVKMEGMVINKKGDGLLSFFSMLVYLFCLFF